MTRVLAQAIVDPGEDGEWTVTVTGCMWEGAELPARVYEIAAVSDDAAACAAIDRYCLEVESDT